MPGRYVVFSHDREPEPWGGKIAAMSELARQEGYDVESVDYRGIDDPQVRINKLLTFCKELRGPLILVGSGIGGYVSAAASPLLQARGNFLIGPNLYTEGYEPLVFRSAICTTTIVHGWNDEVVPVEESIRFSQQHKATLHLLDGDHVLGRHIRAINHFFTYFLFAADEVFAR